MSFFFRIVPLLLFKVRRNHLCMRRKGKTTTTMDICQLILKTVLKRRCFPSQVVGQVSSFTGIHPPDCSGNPCFVKGKRREGFELLCWDRDLLDIKPGTHVYVRMTCKPGSKNCGYFPSVCTVFKSLPSSDDERSKDGQSCYCGSFNSVVLGIFSWVFHFLDEFLSIKLIK